jgi:hypothetical protein
MSLDPISEKGWGFLLKEREVQQEALTRLLVEKGIFTKEEFLEMVRVVDKEMKRKRN